MLLRDGGNDHVKSLLLKEQSLPRVTFAFSDYKDFCVVTAPGLVGMIKDLSYFNRWVQD